MEEGGIGKREGVASLGGGGRGTCNDGFIRHFLDTRRPRLPGPFWCQHNILLMLADWLGSRGIHSEKSRVDLETEGHNKDPSETNSPLFCLFSPPFFFHYENIWYDRWDGLGTYVQNMVLYRVMRFSV